MQLSLGASQVPALVQSVVYGPAALWKNFRRMLITGPATEQLAWTTADRMQESVH